MRRSVFLASLMLVACDPAVSDDTPARGSSVQTSTMPEDAAILSEDVVGGMLSQCSRDAPQAGEGTWNPSVDDILALEVHLPDAVMAQPEASHIQGGRPPNGWRRQYVGLVRDGRRYIYGSYFPADPSGDAWAAEIGYDWRVTPHGVCDGGPDFFGVEYDIASRQFTHIAFNGPLMT